MVAGNFHREKYASLFFLSVSLHSAKEKRNFVVYILLLFWATYSMICRFGQARREKIHIGIGAKLLNYSLMLLISFSN